MSALAANAAPKLSSTLSHFHRVATSVPAVVAPEITASRPLFACWGFANSTSASASAFVNVGGWCLCMTTNHRQQSSVGQTKLSTVTVMHGMSHLCGIGGHFQRFEIPPRPGIAFLTEPSLFERMVRWPCL